MLTAFQKDRYKIIQKYARDPSFKNKLSLQLFLSAVQKQKLKDAAILACLKGVGQDSSAISYFESILEGFPQDVISPFGSSSKPSVIDAQDIYRKALEAFNVDPQSTQYFKNKSIQQGSINESSESNLE